MNLIKHQSCTGIIFSTFLFCLLAFYSVDVPAEILFRPGPGLNDGTDNGSANAGKDTWVYGNETTMNYRSDPYLLGFPVSDCNPANAKAYIQFDLSTLPDDVGQVFLGVTHFPHTTYCYSNCDADFYFYPVSELWNEMTLTFDTMPTESSAAYGPVNITFPNDLGNREYDITDIYRSWKNNSVPNYGLAIYSPTVGCNNVAVMFYVHSSDDPDENLRPYLRVIPACVEPPSGMVSWWRGEYSATDGVGTNHGTLINGTTFASGRVGQAFSFDGVDDYITVPHSPNLHPSDITVDAWIKVKPTAEYQLVIDKGHGNGNASGWVLQIRPEGVIDFCYGNGDPSWNGTCATSASILTDDAWHHVAGTLDGITIRIYIDGVLEGSPPYPGTPQTNDQDIYIGTAWWGEPRFFNGLIDEVGIFNRALTADEIAAVYYAGSAGICFTPDTIPTAFGFTDQTNVALNTVITSNSATISGVNVSTPISIAGGEYSVNSGAFTSGAGTVNSGDTVRVRQTSSSSFSTTTDTVLTIGGVSDTFSVTTLLDTDADGIPDVSDNCPNIANANQADRDEDAIGDACEAPTVLTVNKTGAGEGSIAASSGTLVWTRNTGTETYNYNASLNLTATAGTGSFFAGWTGCPGGSGSACHVTMDADRSVTATFTQISLGGFNDVGTGFWADDFIYGMSQAGITGGCGNGNYCPDDPVTREMMAVFIVSAMGESGSQAAFNVYFSDIANNGFAPFINRMNELGITGGCGGTNYCPSTPVTRAMMAVFILAAMGETGSQTAHNVYFSDIANDGFAPFINKMNELGITGGCGGGHYCPFNLVTRAEMAVFLGKAFLGM